MPPKKRRPRRHRKMNPLAVIVPPEKENIDSRIKILKRGRRRLAENPESLTPEEAHAYYANLIEAMFSHLGVDGGNLATCFEICREFCQSTNLYKADSWKSWDALHECMQVMEKADRMTRDSGLLHCPEAKYLVAVMALEQVVLQSRTSGCSKLSYFMRNFDCYNTVVSAIGYCQKGIRQCVLTLDQPWDQTAKVQRPPNRLITLFDFITSTDKAPESRSTDAKKAPQPKKKSDLIKIESSPEYEAEPAAEHQPIPPVQQSGPNTMLQTGGFHTGRIAPYGVHQTGPNTLHQAAPRAMLQASSPAMHQTSSPAMHQAASHALPQAGQPGMNQYTTPFEHQNTPLVARQAADSRERRREAQMPPLMPGREPSTQNETYMQVTRADVMEYLQPLFDRLRHEDWAGSVHHDIMRILTEQNIKVITAEAKGMLGLWAGRTNNDTVLSWLDRAQEDLAVFQWIERNESPATRAWYSDRIHTIFYDFNAAIASVSEPTVRDRLRAQVGALRDAILTRNG